MSLPLVQMFYSFVKVHARKDICFASTMKNDGLKHEPLGTSCKSFDQQIKMTVNDLSIQFAIKIIRKSIVLLWMLDMQMNKTGKKSSKALPNSCHGHESPPET